MFHVQLPVLVCQLFECECCAGHKIHSHWKWVTWTDRELFSLHKNMSVCMIKYSTRNTTLKANQEIKTKTAANNINYNSAKNKFCFILFFFSLIKIKQNPVLFPTRFLRLQRSGLHLWLVAVQFEITFISFEYSLVLYSQEECIK